ncbi:MAG: glycosyltransferase, partial [Myxococcota bacterium]
IFARARLRVDALRLEIVGEGPEQPAMERRVHALGLNDVVAFAGVDNDVAGRLRRASVFLLPSENESFGLAALEAMACGVPVIGSKVGGIPEVFKDGEGGFLHPVGAVDEMAESAVRLVTDPSYMAQQRKAARARAEHIGAPEPIIDEYERLYQTLSTQ